MLGSFNSFGLRSGRPGFRFDPDVSTYITAVETADGQSLEPGIKTAINDFVVGCKTDGNWDAIKASCILAGARTLNGCLVPLTGDAPTNFNFVSADYDRKTGLKGDGETKYLDSNRLDSADPQDDMHIAVYITDAGTSGTHRMHAGIERLSLDKLTEIYAGAGDPLIFRNRFYDSGGDDLQLEGFSENIGLIVNMRESSAEFTGWTEGTSYSKSLPSISPNGEPYFIFESNGSSPPRAPSDARMTFYSIGISVNRAQLDTRVSALMTAIDGAIS